MPDVVLLHNPEFFLTERMIQGGKPEESTQSEFYKRIESAFEALEELVEEGKIGAYGISTNPHGCQWSCTGHVNTAEATSTERLVDAATMAAARRGKSRHNFKVIQMPWNLLEPNAAHDGDTPGAIAQARSLGLDVMVNRPINAIPPPGFHTGDWSRASAHIKLRDQKPKPPSLALLTNVCQEALLDCGVNAYGRDLSELALMISMSVPGNSVTLVGATQDQYLRQVIKVLDAGRVSEDAAIAVVRKLRALLGEIEAGALH
eukprot:CAMPEP_0184297106 /NCGR_PEP_ID=MMETSP1049-20130417/8045_1 /TAXON_ID=77928 /ORGANISM="Proteomonas sulcata, Strain CCMP704" /LENGTH=260 /DNA_ID=CAMNT_0026606681 /DNA_START=86 /DNA_END=868 /DNA_ORIENTATION=+